MAVESAPPETAARNTVPAGHLPKPDAAASSKESPLRDSAACLSMYNSIKKTAKPEQSKKKGITPSSYSTISALR
jgi:hypothetical protein